MTARVYVEGGGQGRKALRTECRQAFSEFFRKAGLSGRMPRVVACGGRQDAYEDFCHAHEGAAEDHPFLLVDSEGPVTDSDPWSHLKRSDGWDRPHGAPDGSAHLMVQCMESWFYADKESLAGFFGRGFNRNVLSDAKTEDIPKADVENGLRSATRGSRKGTYRKGVHSFAILRELDAAKVCAASPHAMRLIDALSANTS